MGIPSNSVATTVNPVTPDQFNTYVQMCDTVDDLRGFIGVQNQTIQLLGTSSPGDGGQGVFYWNSTGTAPDDNGVTTIIPSGSSSGNGEWTRIVNNLNFVVGPNTSVINDLPIFSNITGNLLVDSGVSLGSQAKNLFLATPSATTGNPVFRTIVAADLPALSGSELIGTTTNDNATAGNVGQYAQSTVAQGSAVSLTSTVTANVTSISLTAGDWDVWGLAEITGTATTVNFFSGCLSLVSANVSDNQQNGFFNVPGISLITSSVQTSSLTQSRFSLAGTTTIFLCLNASFSGGGNTCSAYGGIYARRRR